MKKWSRNITMFGLDGTVLSTKASRHSKRRRFTANAELLERRELLSLANDNFIQGTVFVDNQHTGMPAAGDIFQSATLTLTGSDNSVRTTVSDPVTGQYLFDNLPAVDGSNNEITPSVRLRLPTGTWLHVRATHLSRPDRKPRTAIVLERASPDQIAPLVARAHQLSPRESEIALLVLRGLSTSEIAAKLFVSAYTVQDHFKSIFEKVGVRSRRELATEIFETHLGAA